MRFVLLGLVGCVLTGCAAQPVAAAPQQGAPVGDAPAAARTTTTPADRAPCPPSSFVLRIGIEHLPPADETPDGPRVEPLPFTIARSPRAEARGVSKLVRTPERRITERPLLELFAPDDPLEHEALHFVSDLVEADRRRVRREVGLPFFDFQTIDPDRGPLLESEIVIQQEQEQWLQQRGPSLMRRPLRQLFKRLPLVQDVEVGFDDFRSEHVPLTEPYDTADRRRSLGRISLRVHASDLGDPVEVVWINGGLRVGSSQEHWKLGIGLPLTERLRFELRTRTDYATEHTGFRCDLAYHPSFTTSFHVALGDDMDFLSTSSLYSLFESPMDGAPGVVLYAVHVF